MPPSAHAHLMGLFELSLDKGMTFVRQYSKYLMLDTPEMSLVLCLCNILRAFFKFMTNNGGFGLGGGCVDTNMFQVKDCAGYSCKGALVCVCVCVRACVHSCVRVCLRVRMCMLACNFVHVYCIPFLLTADGRRRAETAGD